MSGPRVALIGAGRTHQGLGPFVARALRDAGAHVSGLVGRSPESAESARAHLSRELGIETRGYTALRQLAEVEQPDAVAILSPVETHERYLERACDTGLHVLCEKPFIWGGPGLALRTVELCDWLDVRRLLCVENCQWPWTLGAFAELHPGALDAPPERFRMGLQPSSTGLLMLGDTLSHPLSMLQALVPDDAARVVAPSFVTRQDRGLSIHFEYHAGDRRVAIEVVLVPDEQLPRRAWYEIDGRRADRQVRASDYSMRLRADERSVPLPDPLDALIRDFVNRLSGVLAGDKPPPLAPITRRMEMLETLVSAYRGWDGEGPR